LSRAFLLGQVLTVLLVAQVALVVWNLRVVRRPPARRWRADAPLISVLVPARNEEASIALCIEALLAQDYPNLEIIVLDDRSTDGTAASALARRDPRVRLVRGAVLPDGWTGKNWACHQLAAEGRGSVLCFVDADTILHPEALSRAAGELRDGDLGLVSMLLHTETGTVAEGVLMPMVNYAVLGLMPAALIERPGVRQVAVALGPFVMVTRAAYVAAGGHGAEPAHIVDDMRLARAVKGSGHRVALRNGTDLVRTRWYSGFREIWNGFSKNAYGGLDYRPGIALAALCIVAPALLFPFLRLGAALTTGGALALPAMQVGLILTTRAISSRVGRDPMWSVPLHPVTVVVWAGALARSMSLARSGREIEWKGRTYATRPPAVGSES
jgi:chlorobactene glucosyltransferase